VLLRLVRCVAYAEAAGEADGFPGAAAKAPVHAGAEAVGAIVAVVRVPGAQVKTGLAGGDDDDESDQRGGSFLAAR
jgi:hypothetical protein